MIVVQPKINDYSYSIHLFLPNIIFIFYYLQYYLDLMSDKRNPFASSSDSEDEPENSPQNQKNLAELRDPNCKFASTQSSSLPKISKNTSII